MRFGGRPQLVLGLGQGNVEGALAGFRAGGEKLGGDGGLSRARAAFQEKYAAAGEAPPEDGIQSRDAGPGVFTFAFLQPYFLAAAGAGRPMGGNQRQAGEVPASAR